MHALLYMLHICTTFTPQIKGKPVQYIRHIALTQIINEICALAGTAASAYILLRQGTVLTRIHTATSALS